MARGKAPEWRMEATDDEGDPITGPWESKEAAEARAQDALTAQTIVRAKAVPRQ